MTPCSPPFTWQCQASIQDIGAAIDYVTTHADEIQTAINNYSAVLFRGFPLRTPVDFGRIVAASGIETLDYRSLGGGGIRSIQCAGVYSTIDDISPHARQSPHHERARNTDIKKIPGKLAFYCEVPAESGGETALCSSSSVAERLASRHPRLYAKLSENRLRYCNVLFDKRYSPTGRCPTCHQSHKSWQEAFRTESKHEVLEHARNNNVSLEFYDDDLIRRGGLTVYKGVSKVNGNSAVCWTHKMNERPCSEWIEYEDGTLMHNYEQECIRRIAIENEIRIKWSAGDFLLLDNFAVQHSKCPHRGNRRLYLAMGI